MNTVCFIGVFQFLGTYLSTRDPIALAIFVNGVVFHGGCRWWKWPDILCNGFFCGWVITQRPHKIFSTLCCITGTSIYLVNRSDLVHVGLQYVLNLPLVVDGSHEWIPPCLLLGTVIAWVLNGSPGLEGGGVAPEPAAKARLTEFAPTGAGPARGWAGLQDHNQTEDRLGDGEGFPEAARPFPGSAAQGLQGRRKGHGRSRSW